MSESGSDHPKAPPFPGPGPRRKPVKLSEESLVRGGLLLPDRSLPFAVQPTLPGMRLLTYATGHRELLDPALARHGAVLFRGFSGLTPAGFEQLIGELSGALLEYTHRSTPRTRVSGRIFTSTEYPPEQTIPLHNEQAYARGWPQRIYFCCMQAPAQAGETPLADSRRVLARISPSVRERFRRTGVMYVRNYGEQLDLPWQEVFQTHDRREVEAYCRAMGISVEWRDGGRLRTSQVAQATLTHPVTGEDVWFNQAHLFHFSSLEPAVRDALLAVFEPEELPRNACYGDGTPIEPPVLEEIREAYRAEEVVFPWQEGDVLMVDNLLVAHGRRPFTGPRRIVVGMSSPGGAGPGPESPSFQGTAACPPTRD
ncbi:TauD/TfdA family dioxygenase [Corallococcus sp. Z5C101001]|uniref:TauD/TfdA family dioxygenase n=1 Tax=Corallococcus sp. Z5C101001 TaxID=2596829 RepID=UPI0011804404|nr:TauD/TfdA family dioxygenase [Corallococcus sp. Z5C101001]TSC34375.1 TauD/TfdA family dioxygenase [Corallococcus sp. Z5C101001]